MKTPLSLSPLSLSLSEEDEDEDKDTNKRSNKRSLPSRPLLFFCAALGVEKREEEVLLKVAGMKKRPTGL